MFPWTFSTSKPAGSRSTYRPRRTCPRHSTSSRTEWRLWPLSHQGEFQGQGGHLQGQQQAPVGLPPQGYDQGIITWAKAPPQ
eukprot:12935604-Prorocentrum_lima.AAC.1